MATVTTTKPVYTAEQKAEGQKMFGALREWGAKDGKKASPNMKLAGVISLLNDCKESLVQYRQYDELSKVDNLINAVKNYKTAEQERITAMIQARASES